MIDVETSGSQSLHTKKFLAQIVGTKLMPKNVRFAESKMYVYIQNNTFFSIESGVYVSFRFPSDFVRSIEQTICYIVRGSA